VVTVKVKVNVGLGAWSDGTWVKPGENLPTIGAATGAPEPPESDNTNNPADDGSDIVTPGDSEGGASADVYGGEDGDTGADTDGTAGSDGDEGYGDLAGDTGADTDGTASDGSTSDGYGGTVSGTDFGGTNVI